MLTHPLHRYQSIQDKYSPKAEAAKQELDKAINNFEHCQVSLVIYTVHIHNTLVLFVLLSLAQYCE